MSILHDRAGSVNGAAVAAARAKRLESAKAEAESYTIYTTEEANTLFVLNPATGRVSTVTKIGATVTCDCPDFVRNGEAIGTCKHIAAACLNKKRVALPPREVAAARAERERKAREFERIFG